MEKKGEEWQKPLRTKFLELTKKKKKREKTNRSKKNDIIQSILDTKHDRDLKLLLN